MNEQPSIANLQTSLEYILSNIPSKFHKPRVAVICGSGLSHLATECLSADNHIIKTCDIPGFSTPTTGGHGGNIVFGFLKESTSSDSIIIFNGRIHVHEGHSTQQTTYAIRVLALLGIEHLVLTCSTGSLSPNIKTGDVVIINDHISIPALSGQNPLIGPILPIKTSANPDMPSPPRFLPLSNAYSFDSRCKAFEAYKDLQFPQDRVHEGIYAMVYGPVYETPAEARMLRDAGADIIGMSIVPEVIAAHHAGIKVLALSLVSNSVVMARPKSAMECVYKELVSHASQQQDPEPVDHTEVLQAGKEHADKMTTLVTEIIKRL